MPSNPAFHPARRSGTEFVCYVPAGSWLFPSRDGKVCLVTPNDEVFQLEGDKLVRIAEPDAL